MNAGNAGLQTLPASLALGKWFQRQAASADDAEPNVDGAEPEPVLDEEAPAPAQGNADDADHLFPGEPPSERLYSRGCRCSGCTGSRNAEVRRRYREHKNGTFRDRRKKALTPDPLLAEMLVLARRDPSVAAVLRRHGHALQGGAIPAAEGHASTASPPGNPPPRPTASVDPDDDAMTVLVHLRATGASTVDADALLPVLRNTGLTPERCSSALSRLVKMNYLTADGADLVLVRAR